MKKFGLLIIAIYFACSVGCIIVTDDGDSSITIENDFLYDIDYIWVNGTDYLDYPLRHNESITFDHLDCGWYDIDIEDEIGSECGMSIELCDIDDYWYVSEICSK